MNKSKNEIISSTLELLQSGKSTIVELVDFKGIMLQKFETLEVNGSNLIIRYKDKEAKCKIKDNVDLVKELFQILISWDYLTKMELVVSRNLNPFQHLTKTIKQNSKTTLMTYMPFILK
ncbi:MAG: hypothetical protein IPG29_13035 [Sphingobacteriales bacterium]|nr:hypothetical protein [Sphingobacteriales bacterium]